MEAIVIAFTTIVQTSAAGGQGGSSDLQRFRALHPPTFRGGGDPVVADHWFQQVERVLEAMEITSDVTRIRLAAFQLEGESQVWWDWVKTSRNLEAMTWGDFRELFMSKFFPASARYAKVQEFLGLRQGSMTVLEYVAKFIELARFGDDYVATDMAKVRKFEDGLKLSIRGKIVGFLLQDMDSMVKTAMAIEREIDDARSIRDASASEKRKESCSSSSSGKKRRTSVPRGHSVQGCGYQSQGQGRDASQAGLMICFYCHQPGHRKRDCPQRWRSQGYGTLQSQTLVGQTPIQFVPSHPGMGQRNQFQSQSATQAPSAAQTGQRGQSMGRGQRQGSQVGTSGTQGPVYAVVPQAKRADQSDMQGMFLLLHLFTRVLFKFRCIILIIVASCVIDLGLEVETSRKAVVWEFSPRN